MPENTGPKMGWREKATEKCREQLISRNILVHELELMIAGINGESFKFRDLPPIYTAAPNVPERHRANLSRLIGHAPTRRRDGGSEVSIPWHEKPRHVVTMFINAMIRVVKETPKETLLAQYYLCMAQFTKDYPHVDFEAFLKASNLTDMIQELLFVENLEEQSYLQMKFKLWRGTNSTLLRLVLSPPLNEDQDPGKFEDG